MKKPDLPDGKTMTTEVKEINKFSVPSLRCYAYKHNGEFIPIFAVTALLWVFFYLFLAFSDMRSLFGHQFVATFVSFIFVMFVTALTLTSLSLLTGIRVSSVLKVVGTDFVYSEISPRGRLEEKKRINLKELERAEVNSLFGKTYLVFHLKSGESIDVDLGAGSKKQIRRISKFLLSVHKLIQQNSDKQEVIRHGQA